MYFNFALNLHMLLSSADNPFKYSLTSIIRSARARRNPFE